MNALSKKRILITGATGFIGSAVTKAVVDHGYEVGIIKRNTSDARRISGILDEVIHFDADLCSMGDVTKAVSDFKPDVVFHLATSYAASQSPDQIPSMVNTNVAGTVNLLEACQNNNVGIFVNTSSCFVYQQSEDPLKEDCPIDPLNLYALTKVQAEDACSYYAKQSEMRCVTLRLFTPYGPFDQERRLIPYIINSFLMEKSPEMTTGKQKWDFIYIDDIVDVYLKLLLFSGYEKEHMIFNIGAGTSVSVKDIGVQLRNILGSSKPLLWDAIAHRKNELWHVCADIRKAKSLLGWEPRINIVNEGLTRTVQWFKNAKESEISKELQKK